MFGRLSSVPFLFVTVLAPAAAAQLTAAQALAQFKAGLADALGSTKASMAAAKSGFFVELAAFEAEVKAGTYDTADAAALHDALQVFMGGVGQATRAAGNAMGLAATDALANFSGGAALLGIYPKGLDPGDGGPIDTFRAAVRKAQDKTISAVIKRFGKTRKLAEKEAGIGLTIVLSAPGAVRDLSFDEISGFFISEESPITVDLLLAVSDLGTASDGIVFLGGTANQNLGALDVLLTGPSDFPDTTDVPTDVFERWSSVIDGGGAGIAEGVYICTATQGTGGSIATGSIGVR